MVGFKIILVALLLFGASYIATKWLLLERKWVYLEKILHNNHVELMRRDMRREAERLHSEVKRILRIKQLEEEKAAMGELLGKSERYFRSAPSIIAAGMYKSMDFQAIAEEICLLLVKLGVKNKDFHT